MRTDTFKLPPLLAAALLLAGYPAPGVGQGPEAEAVQPAATPARPGVSVLTGDQVVEHGEVVEGDMVVHDGDLRIEGKVRGNVVVTGGDLMLTGGAEVLGDAKVIGGSLINEGGKVLGEMLTIGGGHGARIEAPEPPEPPAMERAVRHRSVSWFDPIARGIADIMSTLALGLLLAGIGAALVFYALPYLRTVSDTLRRSTGRSAAVGVAATFLVVPAFVLLVVALAVTIVGIPLLLVAVPLYPIAVVAASGFGLVAAAHALGERTAEQRSEFHARHRNAYAYIFYGVAVLLTPLLVAGLVEMVGFLDWLAVLLKVVGFVALWAVTTVGLGAVLLSRGGRRDTFTREFDPLLEHDPIFDSEPVVR